MFDVGFSELLLIGAVAVVVVGPERLPTLARTLGALFARAQRYIGEVKSDIQREMDLEELKRIQSQFHDAARSVEDTMRQSVGKTGEELQAAARSIEQVASSASEPASPHR